MYTKFYIYKVLAFKWSKRYCNFGQFFIVSFAFIPNAKLVILPSKLKNCSSFKSILNFF